MTKKKNRDIGADYLERQLDFISSTVAYSMPGEICHYQAWAGNAMLQIAAATGYSLALNSVVGQLRIHLQMIGLGKDELEIIDKVVNNAIEHDVNKFVYIPAHADIMTKIGNEKQSCSKSVQKQKRIK